MNLKTGVSKATVNPLVFTRDKHAIDVEPIVPRLRNNRNAHLDYLMHLKESVETIRDIVEEAKVLAHIPLIRNKQVIVAQPSNKLDSTTRLHVVTVTSQKTNVPVPPSTGVDCCLIASGSQPMSHVKPNRISPTKGNNKLPVDDQPRKNKSHLRTSNPIDSSSRLNVERKVKQVWKPKQVRQVWKPTGRIFNLGNQCPLTKFTPPKVVSATQHTKRAGPCSNQKEPNQNWGSNLSNSPSLSGFTCRSYRSSFDKMADVNAPSCQTPTMAPPVRADDQILPHIRPDSPLYLSNEEPVLGYLKFSAKGSTQDLPALKPAKPARKPQSTAQKAPPKPSISSSVTSTQPAPTSAPAKSQEKNASRPQEQLTSPLNPKGLNVADEDADYQKAVEESMKDVYALPKGPLPPVVIREPESGKYQPLPEVPGKGKAKVTEEQVAHDLLSLQKHKKTSPVDQYIFQRQVSEPTASSFHDESPYEVLGQSDNEEESEKIVLGVEKGGQDEGQAGPDPDAQAEDQTGSDADPGNAEARVQSTSSPVVHARSDREHMDLDVANVSPQPSTEQLDEGFKKTVYPNVQENLKLAIEEPVLLEEPASSSGTLSSLQHLSRDFSFGDQFFSDKHSDADKNAETEVESMSHEDHMQLFEALEKSMNRDHSEEIAHDLAEAQKKRKKGRESPKMPPGSPSHQPPPPPPPAGPSGTSGAPGASGSQVTPPPPPPTSTN
nr:hypothetical protein [Tanacetum cinerariifolium]